MSRPLTRLPIHLWLGLTLGIIIAVPALTAAGSYAGLTWWQGHAEQSALVAAQRVIDVDMARWRDPAWQTIARRRLAALGADAQLFSADGHPLFATSASLPRAQGRWQVWDGEKVAIPDPDPKREPRGIAVLFVSVLAQTTILTVSLAAALLALLPTLGAVAWLLRRAIVRPLTAMGLAAQGIREGALEVHLPSSRVQEVADVATALETMSAGLREAAERQASLEQERRLFIGAISHDLRTPLFTLRAFLSGLKDGLGTTPEKSARYVEVCQDKAEALEGLIADLFDYTRIEYLEQPLAREPIEPGTLLRQVVEEMQPQAMASGVTLTFDGPSTSGLLLGDRHLLVRAVQNVLDNALRYTPSGGSVRVTWNQDGPDLIFQVEDSGPGIAPVDLPHLFTPLYRGEASRNRQTGGTGLGLTIARRILWAHGGDLTATNSATGGAIFTGTLPSALPASSATTAAAPTPWQLSALASDAGATRE